MELRPDPMGGKKKKKTPEQAELHKSDLQDHLTLFSQPTDALVLCGTYSHDPRHTLHSKCDRMGADHLHSMIGKC